MKTDRLQIVGTRKAPRPHIRYSANSDGTDFTEEWSESQSYIGIAVAQEAPTDKSGYEWSLFAPKIRRTFYAGSGGNLDLQIANDDIYCITGYDTITISLPENEYYTAHLFVTFPNTADAVGFQLPEGMMVCGNDPSIAVSGDQWEVSIDSVGGALFMRKSGLS